MNSKRDILIFAKAKKRDTSDLAQGRTFIVDSQEKKEITTK